MFESSHLLYLDLQALLKISILLLPTPHYNPQNSCLFSDLQNPQRFCHFQKIIPSLKIIEISSEAKEPSGIVINYLSGNYM